MFCGKCGQKLADNAVVCPACGAPTGVTPAPEQSPSQPDYQQPNYGAPAQPSYQQPTYGAPARQGSQQPNYGAPAQPSYQQPTYGAPAQPAYRQPNYGAPAQPTYRQPAYGAPAQAAYGAPVPPKAPKAPKDFSQFRKIGQIFAMILSALALAAALVATIVWVIDIVESIGDLNSKANKYTEILITYIILLVDFALRFICILAIAVKCLKKSALGSSSVGALLIVFSLPTLEYLVSYIFNFELFSINYRHAMFFANYAEGQSSFNATQIVMIVFFIVSAVMLAVTLAPTPRDKNVKLILTGVTGVLLIVTVIMVIVAYSQQMSPVKDYIDMYNIRGYDVPDELAKIHTQLVFCFLTMLFTVLTAIVLLISNLFDKSEKMNPLPTGYKPGYNF